MLAKLSQKIGAGRRAKTGVYATLLLGVFLIVSPLKGQREDGSSTPWQNPTGEYTYNQSIRRVSTAPVREASPPDVSDPSPANSMEDDSNSCGNGQGSCRAPDCGGDGYDYWDLGLGANWDCGICFNQFYKQLWFRGEYLSWWSKSASLPPLATTSPNGTPAAQAGILGQDGTNILFGGGDVDYGGIPGGRFTLGYWLNPCRELGIEAVYTFLSNKSADYSISSDSGGSPIIARPFYNVSTKDRTPGQDAILIAYPGLLTGSLNIGIASELSSVEVLVRKTFYQQCNRQADFLLGYRYGNFNEDLSIESSSISRLYLVTTQFSDQFSAANDFNGAELGFTTRSRYCRWTMELLAKLALGDTRSRVRIDGSSSVTNSSGSKTTYQHDGLLALPTNIGVYEQNAFSVIPELGATVGYNITCRLKATVGYTLLYWSRVVRPGDQIDTYLNSTQMLGKTLSGVPFPQPNFVTTDFWAQGINVGLEYRF
ncbi:MAG: BBP7 family outer membrane beta-barrel protein [Thermoguttaceae bacterium]|jgi:hypothetical protein